MRILYITTIGATMEFFNSMIGTLIKDGHNVDIACSETDALPLQFFRNLGCRIFSLSCSRSVKNQGNLKAIREIRELVAKNQYEVVHCHTPIAAACTRIACRKARKTGTKVIYTAHGFHFFKGAPLVNWLLFYPVEWLCSFWTDILITINQEDFARAKKLHAKQVEYVPGVGVDLDKFEELSVDKAEKRRGLKIPEDSFVLLSVGEVNQNKNHQVIIRAMAELNVPQIHYLIAGKGDQREALEQLAQDLKLSKRVHFLGYRNDIPELCKAADLFCFPSQREGLGLAALEAMAAGLPLVTSNVHGINDYSVDGETGYKCGPNDVKAFANAIFRLLKDSNLCKQMGQSNQKKAEKYGFKTIEPIMLEIYKKSENMR